MKPAEQEAALFKVAETNESKKRPIDQISNQEGATYTKPDEESSKKLKVLDNQKEATKEKF